MNLAFTTIETKHVESLMPIENAAHSHPWSEKTFTSCIGGRYFGEYTQLDNENNIAGFYIGEQVADEATLMDICVSPSKQGHGYGKALLTRFIDKSVGQGAKKIWLEVRSSNISAQMLYINQGFIETGRRTGYYPKAIGYEDAIVMCKTL